MNLNSHCKNDSIGQFFTPNYVAKFMVRNVVKFFKESNKRSQALNVLERVVGRTVFLKHISRNDFSNITAYEISNFLQDDSHYCDY